METVDEEVTTAALGFMEQAVEDDKPFFVWWNSTRMHVWTHLKEESEGKTGQGIYADGMVEHDGMVGQLLAKLEELGIADNTIVMYSTDNGAEVFTWPDGGTTMFAGEKATQWEGGFRVPTAIRWPGVTHASFEENIKGTIKAGKLADFVILAEDPHDVDPDTIKEIPVVRTVVGGRTMHTLD